MNKIKHQEITTTYKGINRFGQAKFAHGGSILGSCQFSLLPQLCTSKNDTHFKSGQI